MTYTEELDRQLTRTIIALGIFIIGILLIALWVLIFGYPERDSECKARFGTDYSYRGGRYQPD